MTSASRGCAAEPVARLGERHADDARHVDLVQLAVGRALRARAREVDDLEAARGRGRCRAARRPSRSTTSRDATGSYGGEAKAPAAPRSQRSSQRVLHEGLPDQRGVGAAGNRVAVVLGLHRPYRRPDSRPRRRRRDSRCSRRTTRRRSSRSFRSCRRQPARKRRASAGALLDDALEDVVTIAAVRARAARLRDVCVFASITSPSASGSPRSRAAGWRAGRRSLVDPEAAVRKGHVRAGELERVDRLAAETDREVAVELARHPESRRRLRDALRADQLRQLRVDGVVRVDRGRLEVGGAEIRRPRSSRRDVACRRGRSLSGFDSNVVAGAIPCSSAAASTNGLNDDPGWRSLWTARLNWLSR